MSPQVVAASLLCVALHLRVATISLRLNRRFVRRRLKDASDRRSDLTVGALPAPSLRRVEVRAASSMSATTFPHRPSRLAAPMLARRERERRLPRHPQPPRPATLASPNAIRATKRRRVRVSPRRSAPGRRRRPSVRSRSSSAREMRRLPQSKAGRARLCTRARWARSTVWPLACKTRHLARRRRSAGFRSARSRCSSRARLSPARSLPGAWCCRALSCTPLRSSTTMRCAIAIGSLRSTRRWPIATNRSKAMWRRCRRIPASRHTLTSSSAG